MNTRKVILAVCSVIFIAGFFSIGFYNHWITERVITPVKQIREQMAYLDPEERKVYKYQSAYIVSKNILDYLVKVKKTRTALVLLPPKGYIDSVGADYLVPEPVVFYYYTGLRSKWVNSPGVDSINYAVLFYGSELSLIPVDSDRRRFLIREYSKHKLGL